MSVDSPTTLDLITEAAILAGVIDPRESLNAADAMFMRNQLDRMIGSWSNEGLMTYETYIDSLPLTDGVASYSTSLLAHGRPVQWDNAFVRMSGGVDQPVELIGQQEYNALGDKTSPGIPNALYVNTAFPDAMMFFFPVPIGGLTAYIGARGRVIPSSPDLTDTVGSLPGGYNAAITNNLAIALAVAYGLQPAPMLIEAARNSKMVLKRTNHRALVMDSGVPLRRGAFNIYSG